jgi:hypothetical protein
MAVYLAKVSRMVFIEIRAMVMLQIVSTLTIEGEKGYPLVRLPFLVHRDAFCACQHGHARQRHGHDASASCLVG